MFAVRGSMPSISIHMGNFSNATNYSRPTAVWKEADWDIDPSIQTLQIPLHMHEIDSLLL